MGIRGDPVSSTRTTIVNEWAARTAVTGLEYPPRYMGEFVEPTGFGEAAAPAAPARPTAAPPRHPAITAITEAGWIRRVERVPLDIIIRLLGPRHNGINGEELLRGGVIVARPQVDQARLGVSVLPRVAEEVRTLPRHPTRTQI